MPEKNQKEPIAECANIDCEVQVFSDQTHWVKGHLKYCSGKCFAVSNGAVVITAEK